jgi:hypothetical protein
MTYSQKIMGWENLGIENQVQYNRHISDINDSSITHRLSEWQLHLIKNLLDFKPGIKRAYC